MRRNWTEEDLAADWHILPHEQELIGSKRGATRLGFALLLKFFQLEGRFPSGPHEIPAEVVRFVASEVGVDQSAWDEYPWQGRSVEYHRASIRAHLGFREATVADAEALETWLVEEPLNQEHRMDRLRETVLARCWKLHIEPPTQEQIRRLLRSAIQAHETRFCESISGKLDSETLDRLDMLLKADLSDEEEGGWTVWQTLKEEPGRAGLESVKEAASRLQLLRNVGLPAKLFQGAPPKLIERYSKRAAVEEPFELRRHAGPLKVTIMAAFLRRRSEDLTDHLADLLVETVQKIGKGAEKKIDSSLERALQKKASGKISKLYQIAKASVGEPKGAVEDVIFPVAPEPWLRTLIEEVETSTDYKGKVRRALHRSYRAHYRPMLPEILNNLEFRCTNTRYQPIMEALKILKENLHHKGPTYPKGVQPPLKGIVPSDWMSLVTDGEGKRRKINRTAYEICVLKALREQLRCREIWIIGSRRYRNPEEDLPQDFEERKATYYEDLGIPLDAKAFTAALREELPHHLKALDKEMPTNSRVKIVSKKGEHRISITPLEPKPDPENLAILKQEVNRRWWGTSLLDMLKETDLRLGFTQCLRSGTERSHMDETTLQRRLLLCLFGLGTNTGIKSMESRPADDYKDLLYVRRRFVSPEGLRQAIAKVVNATLAARLPRIWGEATTACASDSKQFGAWDQNLLTEYHLRYGGRGVMVYWHVEKNAACIYSQLKRVSSSEAAYMIEGVLRHCTDMEVNRQYVDSHGQTTVAFAFCRLLGFELMPRLKDIGRQKLHKAEADQVFENLDQVMAPKAINWELIEEWLDAMVKHAVALKLGMADAESLLRRFTRNNIQHPVYKALFELGKVIKTIFLCRYLSSEEMRREVHEGLNVVESWNGTNGFIFYGKAGELATNRRENQEISLLCLHLLQASMVYINTLMIQEVLGDPEWLERMTIRDLAALSPLLTLHINPYGRFDLDMDARIPIEQAA
jgi:TnpA family transposase